MDVQRPGGVPKVSIYLDRVAATGPADAWNKAIQGAQALRRVGFPKNITIELRNWQQFRAQAQFELGEI